MSSNVPTTAQVRRRLAQLREPPRTTPAQLIKNAAASGSVASLASAATLMVCSVFSSSRKKSPLRHCAEAVLSAGTAYMVDYHLIQRRTRPGTENHANPRGMVAVYAAFAAGLAIAAIVRDRNR